MDKKKKVFIFGGLGFIGQMLTKELISRNYEIVVFDVIEPKIKEVGVRYLTWDINKDGLKPEIIEDCYGIINLAGVSIATRWTREHKKKIYESRINTTHNIVQAIEKAEKKPSVLVSASACGYYGDKGSILLTEESAPGNDFLAQTCTDWEGEALAAKFWGVRVALIRTANVLGPGGLLAKLKPIFKIGLGGYFGTGAQYMPWIHWKDIVGIYIFALENQVEGAFNTGAGATITQKELFEAFAKSIHSPKLWKIPEFITKNILGKFGEAMTYSQNTSSEKILNSGYKHQFTDISSALKELYPN